MRDPRFKLSKNLIENSEVVRIGTAIRPLQTLYMQVLKTLYFRLLQDRRGQDLIEYALMAGFVAIAAGAVMPGVADQISTIFSKVQSQLSQAAAGS